MTEQVGSGRRPVATPARWPEVKALFWAAHEAPPDLRAGIIVAGTNDPDIRDQVQRLLDAAGEMGDRFEQPATGSLLRPRLAVDADASTFVGRRIGLYQIERRIGQGGMGAVYEATRADGAFEQRVAIKTLWRGADSTVLVQRFRSERQILASLEHPNIARLIDGGATDEGTPYLVMELVDGVPIDRYCNEHRLSIPARLDLFRQVCAAVQYAHRCLIVHRDIKPSNVLVTANGAVKLLDFGIAKLIDDPRSEGTLTGAGLSPFTTAFAAPEQVAGGSVSTATDVYALGGMLMTLLAGRAPFVERPGDARSLLEMIRDDTAPAPSTVVNGMEARTLRGNLDAIVLSALRKDPARRYASVDALSEDVHRHLRGERVLARPDTFAYRVQTFVGRRRALVATSALAVVLLLATTTVALRQARSSRLEAQRSEQVSRFLAQMIGATNADMGNPFMRTGTRGTVAEMLDSALRRVATDFPGDSRVRARLYTAIGSSYIAQSRIREAAGVLDSAVQLARAGYGPRSDAFAEANVAASSAAFHRSPVGVADRYAHAALDALAGRESQSPELFSRALVGLAAARLVAGDLVASDSLAHDVVARELRRTRAPSITRSWALDLLGRAAGVRLRLPRADSLLANAVALGDSLQAGFSVERLDAMQARAQTLMGLAKYDEAERLIAEGLSAAQRGYGPASREVAIFLATGVPLARRRGDVATAVAWRDSAARIVDSIPEVNSYVHFAVLGAMIADLMAERDYVRADSIGRLLSARVKEQGSPISMVFTALLAGNASFFAGRFEKADGIFREGLAICPATTDLAYYASALRFALAINAGRAGWQKTADSVLALLPTPTADAARVQIARWRRR